MTGHILSKNEIIFIDNLKHLRSQRKLSQGQMAIKLKVKKRRYERWEQKKAFPNEVNLLLNITEIFEVTLHDMLTVDLTAILRAA